MNTQAQPDEVQDGEAGWETAGIGQAAPEETDARKAEIVERLQKIRELVRESAVKNGRCAEDIQVMAVTKTVPPEWINFAWKESRGMLTLLGENRVQEYLEKQNFYCVGSDRIHMIGHLQSNKVKYIIDKVSMIESVSSVKLAEEIDRRARLAGLRMEILLEVNISGEASKSGFSEAELFTAAEEIATLPGLCLKGLMCIPQRERGDYFFARTEALFQELRIRALPNTEVSVLSMGMSADYQTAIEHGANIIRLGSAIFGERKR